MTSTAKTTRLDNDLIKAVKYRTEKEHVDESTAIRQLLHLGIKEYAITLYKEGNLTLREAAHLCTISVREMLDLLTEHGIHGNISYDLQKKSLEIIKNFE